MVLRLLVLLALMIVSAMASPTFAERLAMREYTTADGLPSDLVTCAHRDSRGFLWVCTGAGLARFDGEVFTSYTGVPGLPNGLVRDLLETRDGTIWIGTASGVSHFDPRVRSAGQPGAGQTGQPHPFRTYLPITEKRDAWDVRAFVQGADGTLWVGAVDGLYRRQPAGDDWRFEQVVPNVSVWSLVKDETGTLWAGTTTGLLRRDRTGRIEQFADRRGLLGLDTAEPPNYTVRVVFLDVEGRLWISVIGYGVCRLRASTDVPQTEFCYTRESGLIDDINRGLTQSVDGSIWVASNRGPMQIVPPFDGSRARLRSFEGHEGLDLRVLAVTADRDDNIWLSTSNLGLVRVAGGGFTRYGRQDGLTQDGPPTLFLDRTGALCHVFADRISRFDGERFVGARLPVQRDSRQFNFEWGWTHAAALDREGRWWVATDQGAYRFPAVPIANLATTGPDLTLTTDDGLAANHVALLFVDSTGAVWTCTAGVEAGGQNGCTRRHPISGAVERIDWATTGAPNAIAISIAEDHHGQVWLGLLSGGLLRYAAGRLTAFGPADGVPGQAIRALHVDRRGRLWIGSSHEGLARLDDPRPARPRFVTGPRHAGLSSDAIYSIAEGRFGRLYFGTPRGLDQLDPETGRIRHFTARDGLGAGGVHAVLADAQGAIWFATTREITRFVPRRDGGASVGPARIMRVRVDGSALPLSDLGERHVGELKLGPGENNVQIDFASALLATGESVRYEYRLVGAGAAWSEPSWERSITYAKLRPGRYRFEVRTSSMADAASAQPAVAVFVILPPIWQRWWFLLLVGVTVALAIYAAHRLKLQRVIALERMRVGIATDLHDEIGGTLSRMAILTEVVKRQASLPASIEKRLDDLGETARGVVDAMSDVVWSIDPRRDHVASVFARVREHAHDVLDGTALTFMVPASVEDIRLDPDQRRHLYLILKEALTNVGKHAHAKHVAVSVTTNGQMLHCQVQDDGHGFEATSSPGPSLALGHPGADSARSHGSQGNGLANMQARAAMLGGRLEVQSSARGTTLGLDVPMRRQRYLST